MKKLIYSITALTLLIFSCQKEKELEYVAGQTKGMLITNYNTSIKADHLTGNQSVTLDLDINADGLVDIQFTSSQDSIQPALCGQYTEEELVELEYEGKKFFVARTDVYIPDGIFQISIHENSALLYEITSDQYSVNRPNGVTYVTEITHTKTKPSFITQSWDDFSTVQTFQKEELIPVNQLFSNSHGQFGMNNIAYTSEFYYKEYSDLRHGTITRKERNCFEVPSNEVRYIIFKSAMQWGWISFEITEENRITIIDVAISKK